MVALSIKCWICHSDSDPKCADPFDNTTLPIRDCREIKKSHLFATETGYDALLRKENETKGLPIAARKLLSATMCRKIRQKIHGNWRTIRDCAFLGSPGEGTGNEHHCLYRRGTDIIWSNQNIWWSVSVLLQALTTSTWSTALATARMAATWRAIWRHVFPSSFWALLLLTSWCASTRKPTPLPMATVSFQAAFLYLLTLTTFYRPFPVPRVPSSLSAQPKVSVGM